MKYLLLILVLISSDAFAGGWVTPAVPTRIDIERGGGFMVYGAFGNVGECTFTNRFYVEINHPQYDQIYSTVLAAYMSGKKVRAYTHVCKGRGWYATLDKTFNTLTPSGALNIQN